MIFITRPTSSATTLCEQLTAHHFPFIEIPLIEIVAGKDAENVDAKIAALPENSVIIALSQYAVKTIKHTPTLSHHYFAIGKTSAQKLAEKVERDVIYPQHGETSEHFLQLPALENIKGKHVLILKGYGGRKQIMKTLLKRGAKVDYAECYRRKLLNTAINKPLAEWKNDPINIIVVTSSEILNRLYELTAPNMRQTLIESHLIVVSERIAHLATQLGWKNIVFSPSADNLTLFNTIKKLHPLGMKNYEK